MLSQSRPRTIFAMLYLAALSACKPPANVESPAPAAAEQRRWSFGEHGVMFDADFPRARLSSCEEIGPGEYGVVVRPENLPVNDSPWFAFRVSAADETTISVHLRCQGGSLRYRPKISTDGVQWVMLPEECYDQATDR
jgi:hypothetical protein